MARPQHDADRVLRGLVVEGQGGDEGQIARGVVMPVEDGQLLLPMGGIDGGVEVDGDALDPPLEPALMLGDDGVGQRLPHRDHLPQADRVLEAREGGLRPRRHAGEGTPLEQAFVDEVLPQPCSAIRGAPARSPPPAPDTRPDPP